MTDELQLSNGDDLTSAANASPWRVRCIGSFALAVGISALAGYLTMALGSPWFLDGYSSCGPAPCLFFMYCLPFSIAAILLGGAIGALAGRSSGDRWKSTTYGVWGGAVIGILLALLGGWAVPFGVAY